MDYSFPFEKLEVRVTFWVLPGKDRESCKDVELEKTVRSEL